MAGYSSDKKKKDSVRKDKSKPKTEPTTPTEEFEPDLSNPFDSQAQMGLRNQLGGMAGLWGTVKNTDTNQTAALADLMNLWRSQQIRPEEAYMAQAKARDPAGFATQQYQARMNADPWGPGGAFEGRGAAAMTPEAVIASQGNTAENQWAQLGGNKGVDPEELARLNAATYNARKTYM